MLSTKCGRHKSATDGRSLCSITKLASSAAGDSQEPSTELLLEKHDLIQQLHRNSPIPSVQTPKLTTSTGVVFSRQKECCSESRSGAKSAEHFLRGSPGGKGPRRGLQGHRSSPTCGQPKWRSKCHQRSVEIEEVKVVSFWINIIDFVSNNSHVPRRWSRTSTGCSSECTNKYIYFANHFSYDQLFKMLSQTVNHK